MLRPNEFAPERLLERILRAQHQVSSLRDYQTAVRNDTRLANVVPSFGVVKVSSGTLRDGKNRKGIHRSIGLSRPGFGIGIAR